MRHRQSINFIFLAFIFLFTLPVIAYSAPPTTSLLLDYGPTSGTPVTSCWSNHQSGQNFAERFSFLTDTLVEQIDIFVCRPDNGNSVHIKILDDASGIPGTYLYQEDQTPSSWTLESPNIYRIHCQLTTPFVAQANTTYWIGVAGNLLISQLSVRTPDDGYMAEFIGIEYSRATFIGDMMFQLYGKAQSGVEAIPTMNEWGIIIMSLILAGSAVWIMRRNQIS